MEQGVGHNTKEEEWLLLVQGIAHAAGLTTLHTDAAELLAEDARYRAAQVLLRALLFAKHSKRTTLTPLHVEAALQTLLKREHQPRKLHFFTEDDTTAQQPLDLDRLLNSVESTFQTSEGHNCPPPPVLQVHWLALDGVQPVIPQNANTGKLMDALTLNSTEGDLISSEQSLEELSGVVKHLLSRELQLYLEKVISILKSEDEKLLHAVLERITVDSGLHQLVPYFTQFLAAEVTVDLEIIP